MSNMSKLTWDQLNPGDYIAAVEFSDKPVTMTIKDITRTDFEKEDGGGHEKRGVVSFVETERKWVLNKTNIILMRAMWPRMEDSFGHKVTLGAEMVQFGREKVPGIRVVGSPELTAPIDAEVKLPRRKAKTVRLTPTVKGAASETPPEPVPVPEPAAEQQPVFEMDAPADGGFTDAEKARLAELDDYVLPFTNKMGSTLASVWDEDGAGWFDLAIDGGKDAPESRRDVFRTIAEYRDLRVKAAGR